jgi:hypothetical protein
MFEFRFRHHRRDLVAHKPHDVGPGLAGAGSAQDGLVLPLQPVLVDRDVPGGVDRDDPRRRFRRAGLDEEYPRMRTIREQHLHMQHTRHAEVAGVGRFACHLAARVNTGQRFSNGLMRNHERISSKKAVPF